jgi:ubiquitin-like protein ATG12
MSDSEEKKVEAKELNEETSEVSNLTANVENIQIETENTDSPKENKERVESPIATAPKSPPNKIEILLKAVGNAPILKKKKFLLDRSKNVHYIIEWLKKYMKLETKDQLFIYVNQEFAPSPDAEIGTIFDCFKTGNNVILHYCTTPAWG